MKAYFLFFILAIGASSIHGTEFDDDSDEQIDKRGVVQDLVDTLLARSRDKLAAIENNNTLVNYIFSYFKTVYNRAYQNSDEERARFYIFKQRLLNIVSTNLDISLTYDAEVNLFADWSDDEFNNGKKGLDTSLSNQRKKKKKRRGMISSLINSLTSSSTSTSSSLDWVSKGYVTAVKDQKSCGDCYAFATMAVLESVWAKKTGQLVEFSPQELTDCASAQGNHGCNGGNFAPSIRYLNTIGGRVSKWTDYTYRNGVGSCRITSSTNPVSTPYKFGTIQYSQITKGDENSLMEALKKGPVYIGINAKTSAFASYKSGVINLSSSACSPNAIDHAVTLVGYGRDSRTGLDYWKIKNSWSSDWGEAGYVRMARGKNTCGIANMAYQVTST